MGWVIPILAGGLILAAAGTALSLKGNADAQSAINDARAKENVAQQGYQRRATGLFNQNLPNNSAATAQAQIAEGQAQRQNAFSQLKNVAQANTTPNISAPEQAAAARAATAGNAYTNNATVAQAKLGGYGDWGTALGVANADTNSRISVVNNEARANAAQLPLNIEVASHKGDALSGWGRVISAIGTTVGGAAGAASEGSSPMISLGAGGSQSVYPKNW